MHLKTILAAGLILAAASPLAAKAQNYRAQGTEPFWSLTLDGHTMRFTPMHGSKISVAQPRPIIGFAGERYQTRKLTVDVIHAPCSDGMSDGRWRDTVTVTAGKRSWKGCGGDRIAAEPEGAALGEHDWVIRSVAGQPVAGGRPATLRFANDGRMTGNSGCNSFNGSYRVERSQLIAGPVISTKMACPGTAMRVEQNLFAMLDQPLRITWSRGGRAVLTAQNGRQILLDRAPR